MSEMSECCPECGFTDIYQRQPGKFRDSENEPEKRYWCERCKTGFDHPETKQLDPEHPPRKLGVSNDQLDAAREALGIEVKNDG